MHEPDTKQLKLKMLEAVTSTRDGLKSCTRQSWLSRDTNEGEWVSKGDNEEDEAFKCQ